jgi:hypothetical protein
MIPLLWLPWMVWASFMAAALGAIAEPLEADAAGRRVMADLDRVCRDFAAKKRARKARAR